MGNREWGIVDIDDENSALGFAESEPTESLRDHRDLTVWQRSMSFAVLVYEATAKFPREEIYGLTSQLRRAATSIPANIAEGYGRETTGAYIQFLRVSQGSAKETQTLLELAARLGFLSNESFARLDSELTIICKLLRALIRALERKANS